MTSRDLTFIVRFRNEAGQAMAQLRKDLDAAAVASRKTKDEAAGAAKGFDEMGGSISDVAQAAGALFAAFQGSNALQGFIRDALETDRELVAIQRTTKLSGEGVRALNAEFDRMAETLPLGAGELRQVAATAGQLGIEGVGNLLAFTSAVGKLSKVSDLAGQEAAFAINTILKLTDEPTDTAEGLANAILALGVNAAATETEIATMSREIAIATQGFELSSSEVLGLATAMADLRLQPERSRTAVQSLFEAIIKGAQGSSKEASALGAVLGVTAQDFVRLSEGQRPFETMLTVLDGIRNSLDQEGGLARLDDLFGDAGLGAARTTALLRTLANATNDIREKFALALDQRNGTQELDTQLQNISESYSGKLDRMNEVTTRFKETLGELLFAPGFVDSITQVSIAFAHFTEQAGPVERLLLRISLASLVVVPTIIALAAAVPLLSRALIALAVPATATPGLLTAINIAATATLGTLKGFAGQAAAAGTFFVNLGRSAATLVTQMGVLPTIFAAVRGAASALTATLLANPFIATAAAIAAVLVILYKYRDTQFELGGYQVTLSSLVSAAWKAIKDAISVVLEPLAQIWDTLQIIGSAFQTIFGEAVADAFRKAIGAIRKAWAELKILDAIVNGTIKRIALTFQTIDLVFDQVVGNISAFGTLISAAFTAIAQAAQGDFAKAGETLKAAFGEALKEATDPLKEFAEDSARIIETDYAAKIGAAAQVAGKEAGEKAGEAIADGVQAGLKKGGATAVVTGPSADFLKELQKIRFEAELVGLPDIEQQVRKFVADLKENAATGKIQLSVAEIEQLGAEKRILLEAQARDTLTRKIEEQIAALEMERNFIGLTDEARERGIAVASIMAEAQKANIKLTDEQVAALARLDEALRTNSDLQRRDELQKSIEETISQLETEAQLVGLTAREYEIEALVLEKLNEAKRNNIELTDEEIAAMRRQIEEAVRAKQRAEDEATRGTQGVINGLRRAWEDYVREAQDMSAAAERVFTTAIDGMTDALVEFFTTGKFGWKEFARAVLTEILRIITKLLVLYAVQKLVGVVTGGRGDASSALNTSGGFSAGFAAEGAVVRPRPGGTPFIVGEAGETEAIIPLSKFPGILAETMKQSGSSGGSMGGGPVTVSSIVNVTFNEGGKKEQRTQQSNDAAAEQISIVVEGAIERKIVELMRPGGLLNPTEFRGTR